MMFEERRLHPAAIIFNILKVIKELFFSLLIVLVAGNFLIFSIALGAFSILASVYGILSWYRFSYYVTDDELWIEYGIFKRTKRSIAKNRIQSIDLTESVIHRIFKLTRVQIETASGGEKAEAALSAVSLKDAKELRDVLKNSGKAGTFVSEEMYLTQKEISFSRLLLAGITSGGLGIIIGFIVVGLSEFDELIPEMVYNYTYEWLVTASIIFIVLIILGVLAIIWLLSILWTLLRYGKFTIRRTEDELFITRGLLERKQLTIPLHRIQAIGIEENILRQPFGYAFIFAEIAGGNTDGKLADSTILFPLLHKREIAAFLDEFAPDFSWQEEEVEWTKPPPAALPYYYVRSSVLFLLASIAVFIFFRSFAWIPIALFALSLGLGWLSYKDAGFYLKGNRLLLRYRHVKRTTVLIQQKRIQAFEKKNHALERKWSLASMKISILSNTGGKHYHVKNLEEEKVNQLGDRIAYRNKLE